MGEAPKLTSHFPALPYMVWPLEMEHIRAVFSQLILMALDLKTYLISMVQMAHFQWEHYPSLKAFYMEQHLKKGGAYDTSGFSGVLFSIKTDGTGYIDLNDFYWKYGSEPNGILALSAAGDTLFGEVGSGDAKSTGVIYGSIFSFSLLSTGINESKLHLENIKLFPNPNTGVFTIQSSAINQNSSVEIYNTLGEKIYSQLSIVNSQFPVDLRNQPSGIYLYRITSEKGELVGSGKLIIQ